jgi:hypothetical protein
MEVLIAYKEYYANYMIEALVAIHSSPVILPRSNRKTPGEYYKALYKERNLIERMFNKLTHFFRVATRYDKLAIHFLSFCCYLSLLKINVDTTHSMIKKIYLVVSTLYSALSLMLSN